MAKTNTQGGLEDMKFVRPDIVEKLDAIEDLTADLGEDMARLRTLKKEANEAIKALGVEVPEGGEVRIAIVGEGAAYATTLRNNPPASVEFERSGGIRVGRVQRVE